MIDHVGLEVADLARSTAFYDAVLHALGARRIVELPGEAVAYGVVEPTLWLTARSASATGWGHVALRASGRVAVDAAHAAGLRSGGRDAGAPGPRPQYGPRYYAGYLLDPDGQRVEVVASGR